MKKEIVAKLHSGFENIMQTENEIGTDFWLARDLQKLLGYARWENFAKVIKKAKTSCLNSGHEIEDHFLDVTKMVELGSDASREISEFWDSASGALMFTL